MKVVRKTVPQMIEEISQENPQAEALIATEAGQRYTYTLLAWETDRVAQGFLATGVVRGDRVALWAPNIPEWIIAMLALARIGAILVPVDPGLQKDDLLYILNHSDCRHVILTPGLEDESFVTILHELRPSLPGLENMYLISDKTYPETIPWGELTARGEELNGSGLREMTDVLTPEDPIAIMYTSGTTGEPKGVVLDHLGLINKSLFSTDRQGITAGDRLCLFFPLFHMFGNTCIALSGLIRGAALVMPCKTFEPEAVLRAIHKEQCTAVYGTPGMLIGLIDHPDFRAKRWSTVIRGIIGGAPCPMELMKRLVEDIGISRITVGYGITEASSWITMTKPDDPIDLRVSTIGTPLECNEVKIIDPATGKDQPRGSQGELCTRGFLMKEYYKLPEATASAIDPEGWFHTGDLGVMDEKGYLRTTGRLKDVILRDGAVIHPVEVEEILYRMPEISEVQVFGFPHSERGQQMAAWVTVKEGAGTGLEEIEARLQDLLSPEMRPDRIKIVDDFPRTRSGKVQKFKLAGMAEAEYGSD